MPRALAEAHLPDEQTSAFARDAIGDLSQRPKRLSPKYFYDAAGSELFEAITRLPEYYPTRTELSILRDRGGDIAAIIPKGAALVEFGAGATTKVRLLLEHCDIGAYVPGRYFRRLPQGTGRRVAPGFPRSCGVSGGGRFHRRLRACPTAIAAMPKVGFFPGSTLGNFEPHEACAFLRSAREILGEGAQMIIGVDLEKDERVLYDAYNDAAGVTARFNLNVLVRINRELGGNFDLSAFTHRAIYNRERHRIEMHLISKKSQTVRMLGTSHPVPRRRKHPHREQLQIQHRALRGAGARLGLDAAWNPGPTRPACSRFTRWWRRTEIDRARSEFPGSADRRRGVQRDRFPYRDDDHDRAGQRSTASAATGRRQTRQARRAR